MEFAMGPILIYLHQIIKELIEFDRILAYILLLEANVT